MSLAERNRKIKIAGIGDLHSGNPSFPSIKELGDAFETVAAHVDAITICGDWTQNGLKKEADELAEIISPLQIPLIGVSGNHDYMSGEQTAINETLNNAGVIMLEGHVYSIYPDGQKVTFTGSTGYWEFGKPKTGIRADYFRDKKKSELEKIRNGLNQLNGGINVVLTHFPPIRETALSPDRLSHHPTGFPDLEFHLDCFKKVINLAMHGHSHQGSPEGKTSENIPVYNVAIPVNLAFNGTNASSSKLFRVFEI